VWWSRRGVESAWSLVRDIACWGLGARWGEAIIADPHPADPWEIQLVAVLLGLPLVLQADALRRRAEEEEPSPNGSEPSRPRG
jgi:hypothetical protein